MGTESKNLRDLLAGVISGDTIQIQQSTATDLIRLVTDTTGTYLKVSGGGGTGGTGTSGTSGRNGSSGVSGNGTSGTSGSGSPGTSGTSGSGSPGTSGTSGISNDGTSGSSGKDGQPAAQLMYFLSDVVSDIYSGITYKELSRTLTQNPQIVLSGTCTNSDGEVLLGAWITDVGDPNVTQLDAGLKAFNVWCNSDIDVDRVNTIVTYFYKMSVDGTETFLLSTISTPVTTTIALVSSVVNTIQFNLDQTDRLVIKKYCKTTASADYTQINLYYQSTYFSNISLILPSIGIAGSSGTSGVNGTFYGSSGTSGSGSPGTAGTSGLTGTSGTSGGGGGSSTYTIYNVSSEATGITSGYMRCASISGQTYNLWLPLATGSGDWIVMKNIGTGNVILQPSSTNKIDNQPIKATSLNDSFTIVDSSTGFWEII